MKTKEVPFNVKLNMKNDLINLLFIMLCYIIICRKKIMSDKFHTSLYYLTFSCIVLLLVYKLSDNEKLMAIKFMVHILFWIVFMIVVIFSNNIYMLFVYIIFTLLTFYHGIRYGRMCALHVDIEIMQGETLEKLKKSTVWVYFLKLMDRIPVIIPLQIYMFYKIYILIKTKKY